MSEVTLVIDHESGLHLRPAALFVQTAGRFESDITIKNLTRDTPPQNAKSAIGVMMLQASQGHKLHIMAEGADATEAVAELRRLIESGFQTSETSNP